MTKNGRRPIADALVPSQAGNLTPQHRDPRFNFWNLARALNVKPQRAGKTTPEPRMRAGLGCLHLKVLVLEVDHAFQTIVHAHSLIRDQNPSHVAGYIRSFSWHRAIAGAPGAMIASLL
jgi:hypothetical protein